MENTRGKFKATELKYVSIYSKCIESKDVGGISFGYIFQLVL